MEYRHDALVCWFSELNYYLTKYNCNTVDELDDLICFGIRLAFISSFYEAQDALEDLFTKHPEG